MRGALVVAVALASVACDGGETDDGVTEFEGDRPTRRVTSDGGDPPRDAAVDPADGDVEPDAAARPADAAPDGPLLIRELETCDDICDVYAACDRLDAFDGTRDGCLAACTDAEGSERFMGYRSCVQIADCATVHQCVVPPKPLPSCEAVCEAVAACDPELRLPSGLPDIEDCEQACAAFGGRMRECGEALVEAAPDACREDDFERCILRDEAEDCLDHCDRLGACELTPDVVECTLACMVEEAPEDPLALRRHENRRRCIREADVGDCDVVDRCDVRLEADPETVAAVCESDAECAFFDAETCEEVVAGVLPGLVPGAPACFTGTLERCDEGPLSCFRPAPALAGVCDEYCHINDLCDLLADGETELDCAEACRAARGQAELEGRLRCVLSPTCDDLSACQDAANPPGLCEALCDRRGECERANEGCAEACEGRFDTARVQAELGCTAAAGACVGVDGCVAPSPPECDVLCDALDGCDLGTDRCLTACDNAHFVDPGSFLPHLACLLASDCAGRPACERGDLGAGAACLGWCRHRVECVEAPEQTMVECLQACGDGLEGRDFLSFDAAGECLAAAEDCEALAACTDAVAPDGFCGEVCGELVRCGLERDGDACEAACLEDPDALVDDAACVMAEIRGDGRCRPVAGCIDAQVEPAGPACAALCERQAECDDEVDAFLCERACTPQPADFPVRAACTVRAACEDAQMCLEADAAIPDGCVEVCGGLADDCADLFGEGRGTVYDDAEACSVDCTGARIVDGEDDYLAELPGCIEDAGCDEEAVASCFDDPANLCDDAWSLVVQCQAQMFLGPEAQFLAGCDDMQAQCVVDAVDMLGGPDPIFCPIFLLQCAF